MATVHPSRMGLIPQSSRDKAPYERGRGRSPSPRDRRSRSRDHDRDRLREDDPYQRRDSGRRERESDRGYERRASPQYDDYRQQPPHLAPARQNMYPARRDPRPYGGGGGGADWLESRRAQREAMTVDIWPPSPKEPARSLSPKRKRSRKHKRARSSSLSDSSEEERRRRKEKKRSRKERDRHGKEKDRDRDGKERDGDVKDRKRRNRSRSASPVARSRDHEQRRHRHHHRRDSDSEYDSDDDRRRSSHKHNERRRSRSRSRSKSKSLRPPSVSRSPSRQPPRSASPISSSNGDKAPSAAESAHPARQASPALSTLEQGKGRKRSAGAGSDSDEEVGPKPLVQPGMNRKLNERAYGGALLRGEGSAMAAFLQEDPSFRIPRRGEIGLTSDQIAQYETAGYVMSGSRHKRMNAVRMRKENQVISAEEKRSILKLQKEERERREAILREEFSEIVNERLKAANVDVDVVSVAKPPAP